MIGGEVAEQLMYEIAYKAGVTFNGDTAQAIAKGRWNLEGYNKAKAFEQQLELEDKARWDKFSQEINNPRVEVVEGKNNVGKIILSGAAFLTGLDLAYGLYDAFSSGLESGGLMEIAEVGVAPSESGLYASLGGVSGLRTFDNGYSVMLELSINGKVSTTILGNSGQVSDYGFRLIPDMPNYVGIVIIRPDGSRIGGISIDTGSPVAVPEELPNIRKVNIQRNDFGLVVPQSMDDYISNPSTGIPDVDPLHHEVHPDSIVEIEFPLDPTLPSDVERLPLTDNDIQELINPTPKPDDNTNPDTDTDKPIIPSPNPDIPPYERPDNDPRPSDNPDVNPTPEYPEKTETTETSGLFEKLWEWLKAILDVLFKILAAIIALPFELLELLWDFLFDIAKALFIPSDGFWDDNMTELKKVMFPDEIDKMIDGFESMSNGSGGFFKDIVVSLMGVDGLIVIDADSVNSILENIHSWVRGVIYPLLILFNVNSMYKLIRGVSLVEATRGLANRSKGGD